MTSHPSSDEEIIALERRNRHSRRKYMVGLFAATLTTIAVEVVFFVAMHHSHRPVADIAVKTVVFITCGIFWTGLIAVSWFYRPPRQWYDARIAHRQMDERQSRSRKATAILLATVLLETALLPAFLMQHGTWASMVFLFLYLLLLSLLALALASPMQSDDELTRTLRARAIRFGYLLLIPLMGASYVAILYRQAWVPLVFPLALCTGIAAPAAYFLILDFKAGRSQ